jgi:hypothetical protein
VKLPGSLTPIAIAVILAQSSLAQETANFEIIRDVSPDQKFGVLISCADKPQHPDYIDPTLITAVDLVSLPSKKVIVKNLQNDSGSAAHVVWSQDSMWLAYSFQSGPRVSDIYVYHRLGDDFGDPLNTDKLHVDVGGDVTNDYVEPVRWIKPGLLLLDESMIFRGGEGSSAEYRFTARFDEKTGKSQIMSKKKLRSKNQ